MRQNRATAKLYELTPIVFCKIPNLISHVVFYKTVLGYDKRR
jgi:hypothetical protein